MIRFTIILLLIANLTFAATSSNNTSKAFIHMQELRSQGKLDEALSLGKIYLLFHPSDGDVQLLMGLIYYQKHDYALAKNYLHKTLSIAPNYKDAQMALMRIERINNTEIGPSQLVSIAFPPPKNPLTNTQRQQAALPTPLNKIQALRQKGQLEQGIVLGQTYLKKYPKDGDMLFLVGSLYFQKKKLDIAEEYLQKALVISPNYLDIKLLLINLYLAKNELRKARSLLDQLQHIDNNRIKILQKNYAALVYQENLKQVDSALKLRRFRLALLLTKKMLQQDPNKIQLHQIIGDTLIQLKNYPQATHEYQWILSHDPNNKSALLALIDLELILGHERRALNWVNITLKIYPNDPDFLALKGRIYQSKHMLAVAANKFQKILEKTPNHAVAQRQLEEITKLNPHLTYGLNEAGINTEVDYISDLKQMWQYTTGFYNRDTDWGALSLNLNNATRFGVTASQGLLNILPVVNKDFYFRLTGAYANQPILFPTYTLGGEGFYSKLPLELSAGYDSYKILGEIAYTRYTGSVSKEIGSYFFSFRPYFYRPNHGKNSILYTATFIRYLEYKDTYLKLMLGSGTSPDLANLLTTDFLVISNNYATLTAQFPMFSHRLLLNIGADYQHWIFHPSNRVRNITGGIIGFNYRVEG